MNDNLRIKNIEDDEYRFTCEYFANNNPEEKHICVIKIIEKNILFFSGENNNNNLKFKKIVNKFDLKFVKIFTKKIDEELVQIIITMKERYDSSKTHDFVFKSLNEMNEFVEEISKTHKNKLNKKLLEKENINEEDIVNIFPLFGNESETIIDCTKVICDIKEILKNSSIRNYFFNFLELEC